MAGIVAAVRDTPLIVATAVSGGCRWGTAAKKSIHQIRAGVVKAPGGIDDTTQGAKKVPGVIVGASAAGVGAGANSRRLALAALGVGIQDVKSGSGSAHPKKSFCV